jgi:hypothetical protein
MEIGYFYAQRVSNSIRKVCRGSERMSLTFSTISLGLVGPASRIARKLGNRTCQADAVA